MVPGVMRNLVSDAWTADGKGALPELGPSSCPHAYNSCVGCRGTELATSRFLCVEFDEVAEVCWPALMKSGGDLELSASLDVVMWLVQGYLDTVERRATDEGSTPARMTHYVEDMLEDLRTAHRVREEQLSAAASDYKQRLEKVIGQHERLLTAYRFDGWVKACVSLSVTRHRGTERHLPYEITLYYLQPHTRDRAPS